MSFTERSKNIALAIVKIFETELSMVSRFVVSVVLIWAGGKASLNIPTEAEPGPYALIVNFQFVAPFCQRFALGVDRIVQISAGVVLLGYVCGPLAVIRIIVPIVVSSVQGMAGCWRFTHIGKKTFKAYPLLTNANSPTAVIRILWGSGIATTVQHILPNLINPRSPHSVRLSKIAIGPHFCPQTPATGNVRSLQIVGRGFSRVSAIAKAIPEGMKAFPSEIANDLKSAKSFTFQIHKAATSRLRLKLNNWIRLHIHILAENPCKQEVYCYAV